MIARVTGERSANKLGKSDRERKLHDASTTALAVKKNGQRFLMDL